MTYATEFKLLGVWLAVAVVAAFVLFMVLLVRKPPEPAEFWRTVRRYLSLSVLICCCLPVLVLVVRSVYAVYDRFAPTMAAYWWVPLAVMACLTLVAGALLLRRWERAPVEPEPVEQPQIAAQPMWALPDADRYDGLPR